MVSDLIGWAVAVLVVWLGKKVWDYSMTLPPGYKVVVVEPGQQWATVRAVTPEGEHLPTRGTYVLVWGYPTLARQATRAANRHYALTRTRERGGN